MPKAFNNPENKVIIIGGDHHNGLGLARIFGLNGKKIFAVVITDQQKSWMVKSKFIEGFAFFKTEKEGLDFIKEKFSNEKAKPFIIPYSDGAALELDSRLNEFKDKFHIPSINGKQGKIVSLMDKLAQYEWTQEREIKMAKSASVSLESDYSQTLSNFKFPVILKPEISAKGDKMDIAICQNLKEAQDACSELKEKGYNSIFIQEYLKVDFEIVLVGFVDKDKVLFIANRVLRQWPNLSGSNSFSHIIIDENILAKCKALLSTIANYGYNGLIDVECFWVNEELYLNEINWRNSGGDFRAVNNGFFYAYWFYHSVCSANYEIPSWKVPLNSYSMVEDADFYHFIKTKDISLKQWIKDVRKTRNFAIIRKDDVKPFLYKNVFSRLTPSYVFNYIKKHFLAR